MPIYNRETLKSRLPWVEIDDFEFFHLQGTLIGFGASQFPSEGADGHVPFWGDRSQSDLKPERRLERDNRFAKERVVVLSGNVSVQTSAGRFTLGYLDYFDLNDEGATFTGISLAELAIIRGHWDYTIRTMIFFASPGSPCEVHYHDADEYWLIFRGHFTLDFEGRKIQVGPGDLVAAGMGLEHGAEHPEEVLQAVVMAMPLEAKKRDGHLIRAMHGDPVAVRDVPASAWAELDARVAAQKG